MRSKPTPEYLIDVRRQWEQAATNKLRKAIIDEAASEFGYSYSNMTRKLNLNARKRSLSKQQSERSAELESYTRKVYDFRARAEFDTNTFSIERAYECLLAVGQIPSDFTLGSIRRKALEIGLSNEYKSPYRKFTGRSAPLHLVMIDYSKSEYFHYNEHGQIYMENPDYTKEEEPRLYIAAAVDWYSRACWFRYFITKGENKTFIRDAMLGAFREKQDCDTATGEIEGYRRILQGLPRELYFDRGKANVSKETSDGLFKLQIQKITGSVEIDANGRRTNRSNSKARGMIEKFIRDFKETFEARIWGRKLLGDCVPSFSLTELNEQVERYCEETNAKFHPVLLNEVRWNLFKPALESIRFPPPNAELLFSGWQPRKVQRRVIMGRNKQEWFIAPGFINDSETVDILLDGKKAFIYYDNDLIRLKPQSGSIREVIDSETGTEVYSDFILRDRLAKEVELQSAGTISLRSLAESLSDDLKEFEEKPRSVSEIKEKVNYFLLTTRKENNRATIIPFKQ